MTLLLRKIISLLLLALFTAFFAGTHFFYHSHTLNGKTIVHSHPYKKSGKGDTPANHSHSESAFQVISLLSYFVGLLPMVTALAALVIKFLITTRRYANSEIHHIIFYSMASRAPPVAFSC